MSKIGFHIMTSSGVNSPWLGKFQSKVHLLLAISIGGNIPQLINLCQTYPNTHFIYRAWDYGGLGNSDHFSEYFKRYGTNPEPLIKAHEPVFQAMSQLHNRFSTQLWNECGHERESWPNFIEFNRRFVLEMDRRGLSAAVLGLGPGHPAWEGGGDARSRIKEAWVQARPLFETIINAKQQHYINLHEYHSFPFGRFYPWIIGRYMWLLQDAAEMGLDISRLKIVIGESGLTNPNSLNVQSPAGPNGYEYALSQGYTPEQIAEDYIRMVREVYDSSPNLLGLCYYGLGGKETNFWPEFDLLAKPQILERMYDLIQKETTPVIDTPVIKFKITTAVLNVRQTPSTTFTPLGTLAVDTIVETDGYTDVDGVRWRRLRGGTYPGAYCAEKGTTVFYMVEYVPESEPDWKTEVLAKIEELKTLIEQVP